MPAKTPDDYLKEMMELYKRSHSNPEPVPIPKPMPRPEPVPRPMPEPEPVPMPMPEPVPEPTPEPEHIPEPMPEHEPESMPRPMPLPELPPEDTDDIESPGERIAAPEETSFGWIQVTARTAGNALPLEGVSVLILKERGMDTDLLMSLVTDQSGNTPKVKLPAPPIGNNQSQPYSTYQIRAFLPGYTRMESAAVPVFSGITSIQPFELIPLPVGSDGDGSTIINQNTEPKF